MAGAQLKAPPLEIGRFYTNEGGDYFRCIEVTSTQAQVVQLIIREDKNTGVHRIIERGAWRRHWPIVDDQLLRDLDKRNLALGPIS